VLLCGLEGPLGLCLPVRSLRHSSNASLTAVTQFFHPVEPPVSKESLASWRACQTASQPDGGSDWNGISTRTVSRRFTSLSMFVHASLEYLTNPGWPKVEAIEQTSFPP